ncbi:MAG: hypothetical protein U9N62_09900 [Thermotogota bacterium]|nr:hypothetical protein [Thermotogota bacterium]
MPSDKVEDVFFRELFSVLYKMGMIYKYEDGFYLNPDKIYVDLSKHEEQRLVCSKCAESFSLDAFDGVAPHGLPCSEYNCKGELFLSNEEENNYDRLCYLSNR